MNILLVIGVFLAFTIAIFAIGAAFMAPASSVGSRLQAVLGREKPRSSRIPLPSLENLVSPLSHVLPKSETELSDTRALLQQAGFRQSRHVTMYFGIRALSTLLFLIAALVFGVFSSNLIGGIALVVLGYMLPQFLLKRRISARQQEIRLALPDALDLAIICVEAGLALDQTIERVGTELRNAHPDLSSEFSLVNLEIRAGKPRSEALRNLAIRTGVDDVRSFVAVLIQTERFGTSIASALRVHSDALRTERRQRAEERAAKTTIKMVPVLVVFIFPVLFFVILGPVIIALVRDILPNMK